MIGAGFNLLVKRAEEEEEGERDEVEPLDWLNSAADKANVNSAADKANAHKANADKANAEEDKAVMMHLNISIVLV